MCSQTTESSIASKILLFITFSVITFFLTSFIFILIAASMGTEIFNLQEQISIQLGLWLLLGWIFYPAILFGVILVYFYVRIVGSQILERKREEHISRRLIARRLREKEKKN